LNGKREARKKERGRVLRKEQFWEKGFAKRGIQQKAARLPCRKAGGTKRLLVLDGGGKKSVRKSRKKAELRMKNEFDGKKP